MKGAIADGQEVLAALERATLHHGEMSFPRTVRDTVAGFGLLDDPRLVIFDFCTTGGPARQPAVVWRVESDLAHDLWLGNLHEASLLLSGQSAVEGDLGAFLRFLPAVPVIALAYGTLLRTASTEPSRLPVLLRYSVQATAAADHRLDPRNPSDQALVAAYLVAGLHAECRGIEMTSIARERERGGISTAALEAFLHRMSTLASEPASPLAGVTDHMLAAAHYGEGA